VPWTRSLGLSAIGAFLLRIKRKNTPLLLIVKRRITTVFTLKLPDAGISLKLCPMERVGTEAMHLNQPHR